MALQLVRFLGLLFVSLASFVCIALTQVVFWAFTFP
jgi:hypothetical protein